MVWSEKTILTKISSLLVTLYNSHKTPACLELMTSSGLLVMGTDNLKKKMKASFSCDCDCRCNANNTMDWELAFKSDQDLLIDNEMMFSEDIGGKSISKY